MFTTALVGSKWERKLVSQMSKDDHNKSNVAKWLKSTDISKYITGIAFEKERNLGKKSLT